MNMADTDEQRQLKRMIHAKEQQIQTLCAKFVALAERVQRLNDLFEGAASDNPNARKATQSVKAGSDDYSQEKTAALRSDRVVEKEKKPQQATSLEAILAAARGGSAQTKTSSTVKYSKLLRDMK